MESNERIHQASMAMLAAAEATKAAELISPGDTKLQDQHRDAILRRQRAEFINDGLSVQNADRIIGRLRRGIGDRDTPAWRTMPIVQWSIALGAWCAALEATASTALRIAKGHGQPVPLPGRLKAMLAVLRDLAAVDADTGAALVEALDATDRSRRQRNKLQHGEFTHAVLEDLPGRDTKDIVAPLEHACRLTREWTLQCLLGDDNAERTAKEIDWKLLDLPIDLLDDVEFATNGGEQL